MPWPVYKPTPCVPNRQHHHRRAVPAQRAKEKLKNEVIVWYPVITTLEMKVCVSNHVREALDGANRAHDR
jgi:hypothetical protein